ncbi:MAG: hypothetical protein FWC65_02625, partial [Treponema sp.]|nr:hypothetical protein [Treponema sp.]
MKSSSVSLPSLSLPPPPEFPMNKTLGRVFLPIALSFIVSFAHVGSASASEPWQQISPAGRITFSDLDLCANNQLLFRAGAQRGASSQDALFLTRLAPNLESASPALPIQQLTVFPEKMDMLGSGRILQIRNAFGAVRIFLPGGLPMPISGLPSFVSGYAHASWRSEEMASSADGRWLLYLDPVSPAFGNLVLLDVFSGRTIQIASGIERPERQFPASWSPDSRLFVYERAGVLYHYMIGSLLMPEDAQIRRIGEGTINSISWGIGGDFFYLRGSTLYHVRAAELFARALHAGFLNIGAPAGRIPFEFNPAFDNFWISPDARSLLVARGRRSLFYHPLRSDPAAAASLLPHLLFSRSWSSIDILWPADGAATVLVSLPNHAGAEMQVWRLRGGAAFDPLPLPAGSSLSASLSPNGQLALLWGDGGIFLYDYAAWQPLETLSSRPA